MSSFLFTNKHVKDLNNINLELSKFGKDRTEILNIDNFNIIYNYLFTEDIKSKYFFYDEKDKIICIYDGILVNDKIIELYKKYGENFYLKLDGEYSVVLLDVKNSLFVACTDPFGCRHLSIALDGDKIGASTLKIALTKLKFKNIFNVFGNSVFLYNIKTKKIDIKINAEYDKKNPHKKDFNDWNKALNNSLYKKTKNLSRVTLTLSDGYDSGLIHCALIKNNIFHDIFSINKPGLVDSINILLARHMYYRALKNKGKSKLIFSDCKDNNILKSFYFEEDLNYDPYNEDFINLFKNKKSELLRGLDSIKQISYLADSNVVLTGVEGEIHYYPYNKEEFDLNYSIIDTARSARASCAMFGLDARFVLLDRDLYQETQWLDRLLLKKEYKAIHKQIMDSINYPYFEIIGNKRIPIKNHLIERAPNTIYIK